MELMNRKVKRMKKNHLVLSALADYNFQISYNSRKHIVLRWFRDQDEDIMLVLDDIETDHLIDFVRGLITGVLE